jgi:CubicO group peptidase (beta-lactamase class C family)
VNGEGPVLDSVDLLPHEGILHPQAPSDAFCGAGFGSQMLEVIPSEDMVIVRFGPAPHENINYWIEQNGVLMEAMENDGKQIVHNGVLSRVLDAIVD